MTYPKIRPCPICGSDYLNVYSYEPSGRRYVECDSLGCWYRGPGEYSVLKAIKSHNDAIVADARNALGVGVGDGK